MLLGSAKKHLPVEKKCCASGTHVLKYSHQRNQCNQLQMDRAPHHMSSDRQVAVLM